MPDPVPDIEVFRVLAALVALLTGAHLMARLFTRLRQPAVIGEILGGLLLGPSLLGLFAPATASWLFPQSGPAASALGVIHQLGLLLLMFLTGVQMRAVLTRGSRQSVTVISVVGVVIPFVLGLGLAMAADPARLIGPAGSSPALMLTIAIAIAVTSIPVISRIMLDLGILRTSFARVVLSVAVVEDIALNVVLAVALGLVDRGDAGGFGLVSLLGIENPSAVIVYHALAPLVFFAVVAALAGRWRWPGALPRWRRTPSATGGLLLMLVGSAICVFLGIVALFGALVAGLYFGRASKGDEPAGEPADVRAIRAFSSAFFIPVYFAMVGLRVDLVHGFDPLLTLWFVAFACVVKAGSVYLGARLAGNPASRSLHLAAALNARGGPGIVLAMVALDAGIVSGTFFTTLVLTAIVTSLLAGSWLEFAVARGLLPRDEQDELAPLSAHQEKGSS